METKEARAARTQACFFIAWLGGPASYGSAVLILIKWPEFCNDPPNLGMAMLLIMGHLVAGGCNLVLVVTRGPQWRWPDFWLLFPYWPSLAGWLFFPSSSGAYASFFISAGLAGLITVVFALRIARSLVRAMARPRRAP